MRLLRRKQKRQEPCPKLELERVIGLTTTSACGFACNPHTGDIAYIAGCVVVIYHVKKSLQARFFASSGAPKALSCLAFSYQGGKFLAAGESGHQPAVLVWDATTGTLVVELKLHKFGICCIEFSPTGKHLVSAGLPHDGYICLWEWRTGVLLAKVKASTSESSISDIRFASDGSFFLSAGIKHLKQWTIGPAARARSGGAVSLEPKTVNLGSQKDASFISISRGVFYKEQIASGQPAELQPMYVLTTKGILCLLHLGVAVEKWVDLKVRQGYGLDVSGTHVACACSDGIVRIFQLGSLSYTATLPQPAPYGYHGLTDANMCTALAVGRVQGVNFPDAVACCFLSREDKLAVVYGDHSLYIWDLRSFSKIGRFCVVLSHSGCIWDVVTFPSCNQPSYASTADFQDERFATCSIDGSIRLWKLGLGQQQKDRLVSELSTPVNVYSKDILGVLYMDADAAKKTKMSAVDSLEDTTSGFRCICISRNGRYLAAGDRSGNLRIYDLTTLQLVNFQEAHDAEVLSLSYGEPSDDTNGHMGLHMPLLASGGRDRLIHVYDVNKDCNVIETLDDHSGSVTCVKFAADSSKLLSCSADKSVVFRSVSVEVSGCKSTRYHQEVATRGTIYDMDIDPSGQYVVTVGQDKKLNIMGLSNGKLVRCIKPDADIGEPIKVRIDPSGTFMVCSHSDKYLRIYDFGTGELLTQACGHGEVITGVAWLPDCRRLISVSGDSCIFIWRLPPSMSRIMRRKLVQRTEMVPPRSFKSALKRSHINRLSSRATKLSTRFKASGMEVPKPSNHQEKMHDQACIIDDVTKHKLKEDATAFKFSVSRLPSWAQAKVSDEASENTRMSIMGNGDQGCFHLLESRWVERLGHEGYRLATESSDEKTPPPTIHPSGFGARRRFSVECTNGGRESTPESSLNSQTNESPMSSPPREIPRKETQWNTVHTVFFDEMGYFNEEPPRDSLLFSTSEAAIAKLGTACPEIYAQEKVPTTKHQHSELKEDHDAVLYLSEDDKDIAQLAPEELSDKSSGTLFYDTSLMPSSTCTPKKEPSFAGSPKSGNLDLDWSHDNVDCNIGLRIKDGSAGSSSAPANLESTEDDSDACDDNFSSKMDLFSTHFDKLSTMKIDTVSASTRSSLSARYFARTNLHLPVTSLFQKATDDVDAGFKDVELNKSGCQLAAERERLKLQERQEKMAEEVQRMRERLVNLGIAVCEGGKLEKEHDDDIVCTSTKSPEKTLSGPTPFNDGESPSKTLEFGPAEAVPVVADNHTEVLDVNCSSDADIEPALPSNKAEVADAVNLALRNLHVDCENSSMPSKEQHFLDTTFDPELAFEAQAIAEVSDASKFHENSKTLNLPHSEEEYIASLENLQKAAQVAFDMFNELRAYEIVNGTKLLKSYTEMLPATLSTVQSLSDQALSLFGHHITPQEDTDDLPYESPDMASPKGGLQSKSFQDKLETSSLTHSEFSTSADIENLLERYSVRLSETLASQILALVQKGASS